MTDGGSFSLLGITAAPLVAAFSYASLYIPLYLLFGGVLILSPVSPRRWIPALSMTALPFLSLSFFFRILSGMGYTPVMARVVQAFGYRGSLVSLGILSLFFSMLAVLAGIRLGRLPRPAATPGSSGDARMLPAEIVPVDGCYSGIVESGAGRPAAGSSSAGAAAVSSPAGWTEAVPTSSADDAAPAAPVPFADDAAAKPFPSSDSFAAGVPLRKSPESVAGEPQFTFIMPKIPEPPALSSMAPMRTLSPAAMADLSTPTVLRMEAGRKPAEDSPADVVESIDVGTADEMGGGAAVEPALPNEEEEVWPELPEEAEELGEAFESEEVEIDDLDADEEFPEFEDAEPLREKVDADPEETLVEAEPPAAEIGAEIAAGQPSGAVSPAATRKNGDVTRPSALEKDGGKSIPAPAQRDPKRGSRKYAVPVAPLLNDYPDGQYWVVDDDTRRAADILKETLEEFGIQAEVTGIRKGPVITMFEILPAPGVKLSKIVNLADNIALRLAASRVRIVAPIPGKHAVGIEVPNKHRAIVSFRELIDSDLFNTAKMEIPVILGKDITGEAQVIDLVQTPHLLIAGATGSGKSVCVNSIICTILYKRKPEEVRMILIDPKIVELKLYNDIPHLLTPVITEPKRAFQALQYCIYEMERRYSLLDSLGVRDIRSYNRKIRTKNLATLPLPYIVIIIDEFADLMATTGKELEATLARLAAMSRAVGIHIVLATQRPSIDVITGLIKANIPSRIAFMVAGKFDSRIIIDAVGAEKLLGRGDMLFTSSWDPVPIRIQGAYLSEEEVERVSDHVKTLGEPDYIDDEIFIDDEDGDDFELISDGGEDPLMDAAVDIVASAGKASYLQRRLKIGYTRAARLVEEMEKRGIVGPQNGSKPRDVIHLPDKFRE